GYYGPIYLAFFAVATGCVLAALMPRGWLGGAASAAASIAITAWWLVAFNAQATAIIRQSPAPLTVLEDWAINGRSGDDQLTLAPAHWVLALNPRKTMSSLMVRAVSGPPEWQPGLLEYATDLPSLDRYR